MTAPIPTAFEPARYIEDRTADGHFQVRHEAFTDPALFALEMSRIFESTWLYVALESELARPHDYVTRQLGRAPILLSRDGDGRLHAFLNSCRHRGTLLCPLQRGNQRVHVCRYHGWAYDSGGRNTAITGRADGQYPAAFASTTHDLEPVARVASYRGFVFASLAADVPPLEEHLGEARFFLDLIADQAPQGLEVVPGNVSYTFNANWKYQFENGLDYYHFGATHASFVQILRQRGPTTPPPGMATDLADPDPPAQGTFSFPYGHAVTWSVGVAGQGPERRPLPRDLAAFAGLRARHDRTRLKWLLRQRNLTLFPNLQIVDIQSLQLRLWQPLAVDRTRMVSHCLAPIGEDPAARSFRIRQYEEFFNPSGLATSDDNVMYEFCQTGYAAAARMPTHGYLRGLGDRPPEAGFRGAEIGVQHADWASGTQDFGDETCIHAGYREWLRLMTKPRP